MSDNVIKFQRNPDDTTRFVMKIDKTPDTNFPFMLGLISKPGTKDEVISSGRLTVGMMEEIIAQLIGMYEEYKNAPKT